MENKQELDLCSVIWLKVSEFESKYGIAPNNVILPLYVKEHLLRNSIDFGNTMVSLKGDFIFMGLKVHWTMIDNTESINVFQTP